MEHIEKYFLLQLVKYVLTVDTCKTYHIAGIFRRSLISFFSFSFVLNKFIQNENLM